MTEKQPRTKTPAALTPFQLLHDKAEVIVCEKQLLSLEVVAEMTPEDTQLLFHELRVHQIELEMQNEELRRSQLALDAERTRYFDLYDLAPVSYFTLDEEGLILQVNFTAANLLGLTRSDMVNRPLMRFILPEDRDIYYLYRKQYLLSDVTRWCELRMVNKDGSVFWVQLSVTISPHQMQPFIQRVVLTDITERKQAQEALHLSDQALKSVSQGVVMTCPAQRILSVNDAFVAISGYPEKDILGLNCRIFQGPLTDPAELERMRQCLKTATPYTGEILNYRKDGSLFWNELTISPVHDAQGQLTHFIGITRDITERHRLAAELHAELGQSLSAIKINLQALERLKTQAQGELFAENMRRVDAALQQVRQLSLVLPPAMRVDPGLTPARCGQ